ncbi:MAG TPA: acyl-CoA dehydrogenase family protein [Streptosporangiaceae bacterium]|nr:acyl-CoA dehydrogenase family protein [Streptosporangiaceae bacterium]
MNTGPMNTGEVRSEVSRWITEHWDPGMPLERWRMLLADSGWGCPTWPERWCGRGLSGALGRVVAEEMRRAVVPGPPEGLGMMLVAPVILEHGSEELKERYIRPTVTGEITWCQLFSEPGAGSDLAGLQSRAERDGDAWRLSGQKVWSTGAATADFGLLLARTDWDVSKHQGITAFVLPMRQPGVTVRPLRQMNGHSSFNEVFFDEAHVEEVIGELGGGWAVARATLAHERRLAVFPPLPDDAGGRAWQEAIAERTAIAEPHKWYPQRAGRPDLVISQAQALGRSRDPVVRQEIAKLIELSWSARWMAERAAAAKAAGERPGPEGSLGKLASSKIAKQAARVHSMIAGPAGLLSGPGSLLSGTITEISVSVPAISIAGGTDEIQRSIIAERILGLPREPDVSVGIPFRDVRTG